MTMSNDNDLPKSGEHQAASGASGPSVALIAGLVVIALAVIFFLQNSEPVFIDFWIFEKKTTIRWSILMSIVLGIGLDRLVSIWWRRCRSKKDKS
jgi:uncharacterized integral membrane protein